MSISNDPFKIGAWTVEPELDRISCENGSTALRSQVMKLLVFLASHMGTVISTEELMNQLWTNKVVTEGTVYNTLAELRNVLATANDGHAYIETIPRKGYRLVDPAAKDVDVPISGDLPPSAAVPTSARKFNNKSIPLVALITLVAVVALIGLDRFFPNNTDRIPARLGDYSIAALPFVNLSKLDDDDVFFSDGIHDDLLTRLAKFEGLKVISRTSVMDYRSTKKKMPTIGSELGVANILEGSVQRAGQTVRINVKLYDAATDKQLWSEEYDRVLTIDNLFEIQSEITRHIVVAVKGQLLQEGQQLAVSPTQSVEAYENYLRARQLISALRYNADKYKAAIPYVKVALDIDPNFALAHLLLAEIHGAIYWVGDEGKPENQAAASKSLERASELLGPDSAELLAARGEFLYRFKQDYEGALDAQLIAHAAMPGNTAILQQIALTQRRLGRWDEAVNSLLQAIELNPAEVGLRTIVVETLAMMQRWAQLKEVLSSARRRFADNAVLAAAEAMLPLWATGDVETARKRYSSLEPVASYSYVYATLELPWYERNFSAVKHAWDDPRVRDLSSDGGWAGYRELTLAMAYLKLGQNEKANALLSDGVRLLEVIDRDRQKETVASDLSTLAIALAMQGQKTQAIKFAREAVELHSLKNDKVDGRIPMMWLSYVLGLVGENEQSLELIEQLIDQPNGFRRWELYLHPRWDFFRHDERFNALIRPANIE